MKCDVKDGISGTVWGLGVCLRRGLTVRVESPQDNLFEDDRYETGASPQILQKVGSNQMNLVMKTKRGLGGGSYDDAAGKF